MRIIENRNQRLLLNVIYSIIFGIIILFIGMTISFILVKQFPGDPVLAHLPKYFTAEEYESMRRALGFDRPLIVQFFKYINDFFAANWWVSASISKGVPVWDLIMGRMTRTIDLLIFSMIIGGILGYMLGYIAFKYRNTVIHKIIRLFAIIGVSTPIFFLGMLGQYFLSFQAGIFPAIGYKSPGIGGPGFITGFRIIDSLISGELYFIFDYILHLVLPVFCLSIIILAVFIRQTSSNLEKELRKKTITSNTLSSLGICGIIFTLLILIEVVFNLNGIGMLFIVAITNVDYYTAINLLTIIILYFVIIVTLSNLIFSIRRFRSYDTIESKLYIKPLGNHEKQEEEIFITETGLKSIILNQYNEFKSEVKSIKNSVDSFKPKSKNYFNNYRRDFKENLKNLLKSSKKNLIKLLKRPFVLIGLFIVLFAIIIAIFPQIITSYSLNDVQGVYPGSWTPPNSAHPLGTTEFGRDVLGRISWGIRYVIFFSFSTVFLGVLGGLLFGTIASLHRWAKNVIIILMIPLFIIPILFLIILTESILGQRGEILMGIIGLLLIPSFMLVISKIPLRKGYFKSLIKTLVVYMPLEIGFTIMIIMTLGFLGFDVYRTINLGGEMASGRLYMYQALWATYYPGLALFLLVFGFIVLHYGLKNHFQLERILN